MDNNNGLLQPQLTQDPMDYALSQVRSGAAQQGQLPEPTLTKEKRDLDIGLGDVGRLIGKGATDLVAGAGDVAAYGADWLKTKGATGAIAALPLQGAAAIGDLADSAGKSLEAGLSDDAKAAMGSRIFDENADGDLVMGDGAGDIDVWAAKFAHGIGTFIPTLASGGAASLGVKAGGVVYQSMLKRGASEAVARATAKKTVEKLASKAGTSAAVGMGTAGAVGMGGRDVAEQVNAMPHEQLMESETYRQKIVALQDNPDWINRSSGERLDEARRLTAEEAAGAVMTDPGSWAFAAGAAVLGDRYLYKMLAGKAAAGGVVAGAGKGAIVEGATEMVQEGGQQWRNNETLNEVAAADIDPMRGVLSGALEGGVIGAGTGGVLGGVGGLRSQQGEVAPSEEMAPEQVPPAQDVEQQVNPDQAADPADIDETGQNIDETGDATRTNDNPIGPSLTQFDETRDIPAYLRQDTELDGRDVRPTWSDDDAQQALGQGQNAPSPADLVQQQMEQGPVSESEPEQQTGDIETWQPNWRAGRQERGSRPETAREVEGEFVPRMEREQVGEGNRLEGPAIDGQGVEIDESRALGFNGTINMGGEPGADQSNSNYVPPLKERKDKSVEPESMRDSRMGVGKAINEAGSEADAIWQQLSTLRVTKRGKPFASEKEAQLASRKDEQPVKLPEGYGIAKQEEVAEQGAVTPEQREQQAAPQNKVSGAIAEVPVADLQLSSDVPQFKDGANDKGVVEPLGGSFDRTGVAPIQVWKRKDGRLEVISGRHRLDLARRSGEKTIPAQIHDEAAGFDQAAAATLDAELNIRDNQGKVKDYVQYFQATGIDRAEADRRGHTARALGRRAHQIATGGSEETIAAHRADILTDEAAERISQTAPGDARLQTVGIKAIQDGKSITHATNMMQAVKALTGGQQGDGMGDMFGFDDSGMREAERMAKLAAKKQREISELLRPQKAVANAGALAKQEGITDNLSTEQRKQRMDNLQSLKSAWDTWSTNPELVAELRREIQGEEVPALSSYSETDLQQQADQLKQAQDAEREAQSRYEADQDVDDFRLSGSSAPADVANSYGQNDMFTQTIGQAEAKAEQKLSTTSQPAVKQMAEPAAVERDEVNVDTYNNWIRSTTGATASNGWQVMPDDVRGGAVLMRKYKDTNKAGGGYARAEMVTGFSDVSAAKAWAEQNPASGKGSPKPASKLDATASAINNKKRQAAEELKALLQSRKGQLNSGVDPEVMLAVAKVGALSIADGAVKFAQFVRDTLATTRAVGIDDADVKPFLKEAYGAISANPEKYDISDEIADTMDAPRDIRRANLDQLTEESTDDQRTPADTAANSANRADAAPATDRSVQDGGRGPGRRAAAKAGQQADPGQSHIINPLDGDSAAAAGERGGERGANGRSGAGRTAAGGVDGGGSTNPGAGRLLAQSGRDETVGESVAAASVKTAPLGEQEVTGDTLSDVKARMPFLTDGQAADVVFAEARFSKPDGFGVLFTNGTGTGKTFSGLGVARRFADQGKGNILILVPKQPIADAWQQAGKKFFDLDIKKLASSSDNGKTGAVVTTYANLADNPELLKRDWDLVIPDEAHYLSSEQTGKNTQALERLRALNRQPGTAHTRIYALNADKAKQIKELSEQAKVLDAEAKDADFGRREQLRDQAADLRKQADKLSAELGALVAKQKERDAAVTSEQRPRATFLSATPFAYEKNVQWAAGFLFDYGPESYTDGLRYNSGTAYERFMMQHFGYRMRYNKLTEPDAKVDRGLMQRQFNSWLKKEGVLSARMLESDHDYDRRFVLTENAIGRRVDEAIDWLQQNYRDIPGMNRVYEQVVQRTKYLPRMYLMEALKAREVIPHVQKQLDMGRKVLIVHDYKQGGAMNPFAVEPAALRDDDERAAYRQFTGQFGDLIREINQLPSAIQTLSQAFSELMVYNGDVPAKQRIALQDAFNQDGQPAVMLAQSDAMREGVSIHDASGKHQRVSYNLGLPTKPTAAIQLEGRIYRTGQKSDAMFRYLTIGTTWERTAFASTIAGRASTAENLAMGEEARGLKESFIQAYENADSFAPGFEGEGKGGKATDRALASALTPWDMAKSFYFGSKQQGKGRSSDGREGADFFATPEPLGMKMTTWANVRGGEDVLEPSVGSAAIGRWFPENSRNRAIEQSGELASQAALRFPGEVVNGNFEDHNIVNKYDAIVMNPPFGSGGKTAAEHVAKAIKHLRNEGRIVALIPTGPAADKRFDQLLFGDDAVKDVYQVANIKLPGVTFERAGTRVATRVIVLERQADEGKVSSLPSHEHDLSHISDINELFGQLQHLDIAPRQKVEADEDAAPSRQPKPDVKPVEGVVEHTTQKGKVIRGVIRTDLTKDEAKEIDPYTFKKDGGFFIREKYLGEDGPRFSKSVAPRVVGIPREQAESVARNIMADWKGAPQLVVVASEAELPPAIADAIAEQNAHGEVEGVHYRGTVYIVADNIHNASDVERVLLHEAVGHYGIARMIGPTWKHEMNRLYLKLGGDPGIERLAKRFGINLDKYKSNTGKMTTAERNRMMVDELLAHVAQQNLEPTIIDRVVAKIKQWLRNWGLGRFAKYGKADVLRLLEGAKRAVYEGTDGKPLLPDDVKFSRKDRGLEPDNDPDGDPDGDGPRFSRSADSALDKLNLGPKPDVIDQAKEKLQALREIDRQTAGNWLTRMGRKANTELLDALAPIKYIENAIGITGADNSGYHAARLATGSSSTMLGAMLHGLPEWKNGIVQRKQGSTEQDALLGILQPLGKDLHNWLGWMAGHRAEILMAQGRENLLTADEIQALKDLGNGKERQFNAAKKKWNAFNGAILDLAQEAGLVSAEARAGFESEWYIPFFRETEDGDVLAPFNGKGVANQRSGIKQLKGGANKTNDLLENMFHTTSKMIDAAMKNHAARKTVENLMDTGIIEVIENPNLMDMRAKDKGQEVFSVRHNGEDLYVRTLDKDLFKAMTFLDRKPFDDPFTKVGMAAKRLLTATVTSSPEFMLRNFLRDALSAWTISKDKYNPLDALSGAVKAYNMTGGGLDMMFAGASFMGGYVNANDPEGMADTIRKGLRRKGMSPEQIAKYEKSIIRNAAQAKGAVADAWAKYNRYGEAAENATREAVYEAALKAGKSKAQAAFEAKDQMDFSMLGASRTLQWFTSVLPFFNARVQGLGKLSREFKDNPTGMAKRGGMIVAGSLALLAINWDNEDYEALPDWDKDMHWHFWLGDQHLRIPKPFEVGVIFGTIPERMARAMGDKDTGAEFGKAVARAVGETFALNPIPQAINPLVEVYTNYDSFKGRAIENQYEQTLMPQARYDERTSQTMREIGELTGMSPKQLEHVVTGYLGTMGAYSIMASDWLVNLASDNGDKPEAYLHEAPLIKALYRGDGSTPARSTKQIGQLYDMLDQVTTLHNTVSAYRKDNRIEDANRLVRDEGDILRSRKSLTRAQRQLRQIRNQMDLIRRDRSLNGEQKRARIDRLLARRNDLAARVVAQNQQWFD